MVEHAILALEVVLVFITIYLHIFFYSKCLCPARRTVIGKSNCPASLNHVSYRVRSRGFS